MPDRRCLIVVSNRAPVTYRLDRDGNRVTRRGGGGLVTALRSLVSHHDVIWIASAMSDEDRRVASELNGAAADETADDGAPYRLRLVAHVDGCVGGHGPVLGMSAADYGSAAVRSILIFLGAREERTGEAQRDDHDGVHHD